MSEMANATERINRFTDLKDRWGVLPDGPLEDWMHDPHRPEWVLQDGRVDLVVQAGVRLARFGVSTWIHRTALTRYRELEQLLIRVGEESFGALLGAHAASRLDTTGPAPYTR